MANGSRNDGYTDTPTDLYFNFYLNGSLYDPYDFNQVKIYNTKEDAQNDTNAIETITSANITKISTGRYYYVASALASIGTYFDRVFIYPTVSYGLWTNDNAITPFYIREEIYGGAAPSSHERVRVYLNLFDIIDNPQEGDCVKIKMNKTSALYGNDFIEQEIETFKANSDGQVCRKDENGNYTLPGMDLIETDTLTDDTYPNGDDQIYYQIDIIGKYFINFQVPKGLLQVNFFAKDESGDWKLPRVEE